MGATRSAAEIRTRPTPGNKQRPAVKFTTGRAIRRTHVARRRTQRAGQKAVMHRFSHPDFTVGTGIAPVHALRLADFDCRLGITPNPEACIWLKLTL